MEVIERPLTEQALEDIMCELRDTKYLNFKLTHMVLSQKAVEVMSSDELALVQADGVEALPKQRRDSLIEQLLKAYNNDKPS